VVAVGSYGVAVVMMFVRRSDVTIAPLKNRRHSIEHQCSATGSDATFDGDERADPRSPLNTDIGKRYSMGFRSAAIICGAAYLDPRGDDHVDVVRIK
jgi:hypothetical protein